MLVAFDRLLSAAALAALLGAVAPAQDAVGVVVDRGRPASSPLGGRVPYVHVFDPVTMEITGSVALPVQPFAFVFDVEIAPDLSECYVGNNDDDRLWIIDLTTSPPSLAAGPNPLQLGGGCIDLSLSPDGRYLAVGSGSAVGFGGTSMSLVDVRARRETDTLSFEGTPGSSPTAVEFAADGSLLVCELITASPSFHESNVLRYRIDAAGRLVDTGKRVGPPHIPGVQDLTVPTYPFLPRFVNTILSRHAVYVPRPAAGVAGSLRIHDVEPADAVTLADPTGIDVRFDPFRSLVYVRTIESDRSGPAGPGKGRIDGYVFSPLTGRIGPRVTSIELDSRAGTAFGVEQTALDPLTRRLYVSGLVGGEVRVFDSLTGVQVGSITHPDFLWGLGVEVRRRY